MSNVGLDRLFREEESLADLSIHEPVRDELQNLDLARRRILTDLTRRGRGERDDGAVPARATARRSRFETPAVVAVVVEDLLALGGVHGGAIGRLARAL